MNFSKTKILLYLFFLSLFQTSMVLSASNPVTDVNEYLRQVEPLQTPKAFKKAYKIAFDQLPADLSIHKVAFLRNDNRKALESSYFLRYFVYEKSMAVFELAFERLSKDNIARLLKNLHEYGKTFLHTRNNPVVLHLTDFQANLNVNDAELLDTLFNELKKYDDLALIIESNNNNLKALQSHISMFEETKIWSFKNIDAELLGKYIAHLRKQNGFNAHLRPRDLRRIADFLVITYPANLILSKTEIWIRELEMSQKGQLGFFRWIRSTEIGKKMMATTKKLEPNSEEMLANAQKLDLEFVEKIEEPHRFDHKSSFLTQLINEKLVDTPTLIEKEMVSFDFNVSKSEGTGHTIHDRATEVHELRLALNAPNNAFVFLTGAVGSGRRAVLREMINQDNDELDKPYLIVPIDPAYLGSVSEIQKVLEELSRVSENSGLTIHVYFTNVNEEILNLNLSNLFRSKFTNIKAILETTPELEKLIKESDKATSQYLTTRSSTISIKELSKESVIKMLKTMVANSSRYNLAIDEAGYDWIYENAKGIFPDANYTQKNAAMKLLYQLSYYASIGQEETAKPVSLSPNKLREITEAYLAKPTYTFQLSDIQQFKTELLDGLNSILVGQNRMNADLVQAWFEMMTSRKIDVGSIWVTGPTGTGKTTAAKHMAKKIFGSEDQFLYVDMAQFSEPANLTNFFGNPHTRPKEEGRLLEFITDPLKGARGGIILLDEIEKAHPMVFDRLMQIIELGYFVDVYGVSHSLKNFMFITTSNRGISKLFPADFASYTKEEKAKFMRDTREGGDLSEDVIREAIIEKPEGNESDPRVQAIRPEVINKYKKVTSAAPIIREEAPDVARVNAERTNEVVKINGVSIIVDPEVYKVIGEAYHNIKMGGRQIDRGITTYYSTNLEAFVDSMGPIQENDSVLVTIETQPGTTETHLVFQSTLNSEVKPLKIRGPNRLSHEVIDHPEVLDQIKEFENEMQKAYPHDPKTVERMVMMVRKSLVNKIEDPLRSNSDPLVPNIKVLTEGYSVSSSDKAIEILSKVFKMPIHKISLAELNTKEDINRIIGSPAGYVGYDEPQDLEKALADKRSIIVFTNYDQIGKGASEGEALKADLLTQILEKISEPEFSTGATKGEPYSTKDHAFFFSGSHLSEEVNDDKQLEVNWLSQVIRHDYLLANLKGSGVPEVMLNSLNLVPFKPQSREHIYHFLKKTIAEENKKALSGKREKGTSKPNRYQIEVSDEFIERFIRTFQTYGETDQGLWKKLNSMAGTLYYRFLEQNLNTANAGEYTGTPTMHLSIEDSLDMLRLYQPNEQYRDSARKLNLKASVEISPKGNPIEVQQDLFEYNPNYPRPTRKSAIATLYHEAGHAILIRYLATSTIHLLSAYQQGGGVTSYLFSMLENHTAFIDEVFKAAISYGGRVAERMFLNQMSPGFSGGPGTDKHKNDGRAYNNVLDYAFGTPSIRGLTPKPENIEAGSPEHQQINKFLNAGEFLAMLILKQHEKVFDHLVDEALKAGGTLDKVEIENVFERYENGELYQDLNGCADVLNF